MGRIWRITMVLLSTLAALVIIVHSAEEEYEAQYANRRELRPRISDSGTPRIYEQPWRTLELEPVQQSQATTPDDMWMANSSGEPPRRRRPGRKRKRRPDPSSEETIPIARYGFAEETRPYIDVDERISEDEPKRRKKQDSRVGRWDTQVEEDRPIRRRGLRRKRPSVETWPTFSEFSEIRAEEPRDNPREHKTQTTASLRVMANDYGQTDDSKRPRLSAAQYAQPFAESLGYAQPFAENLGTIVYEAPKIDGTVKEHYNETVARVQMDIRDDAYPTITEDNASEFSGEEMSPIFSPNINNDNNINNMQKKARSKAGDYFKNIDKAQMIRDAQRNGPIDPSTLKEILKKSNGSSLSEILQQNNLTLTDLLHGKEEVLSVLQVDSSQVTTDSTENIQVPEQSTEVIELDDKVMQNSETKYTVTTMNDYESTTYRNHPEEIATEVYNAQPISEKPKVEEDSPRPNIRKFPTAARRKQRIRPMMNTTYKSQLSRDIIALNARKYFNNRRKNNQEWRELAPLMKKNMTTERVKKVEVETSTANYTVEETTIQETENCSKTDSENEPSNTSESLDDIEVITTKEKTVDVVANSEIVQGVVNVTEKPIIQSTTTPVNASSLRRQAFNNRLKKKRLRQKNLTTEPPQDDIIMDLFGIPNLVSSSEFIAQTARPPSTQTEETPTTPKSDLDDVTMDDFITTELPRRRENRKKASKKSSPRTTTTPHPVYLPVSTEETAKFEIEEIFNDTETSMKLARILKERNMTLSELVEHRERGSSHVHLADIFHNASKEPNPPEPFLSKSLIEPISKETYPLRALLDANNHDTTTRSPTDPVTLQPEVNIPVVMNFGSNVNENAENMGIMSLFHNITRNDTTHIKPTLNKDSQGTLYESSITVVNTTDGQNKNNTIRESRVLHVINDNQDDIVSWNEIFSLMRRNYENQTEELFKAPTDGLIPAEKIKKPTLEEDSDGDGVIVLEDLQHLKDFDSNSASGSSEHLDFNTYQRAEGFTTRAPSLLDRIPSQTRSVTVATASIAGLAMVLFLLTYVGYRWQQHRLNTRKKSFHEERVPSPVFESRKGNKNNSSSRSISPMLTSNIYTLNTLDSRNGKESPDYMWDSLRKPFQ